MICGVAFLVICMCVKNSCRLFVVASVSLQVKGIACCYGDKNNGENESAGKQTVGESLGSFHLLQLPLCCFSFLCRSLIFKLYHPELFSFTDCNDCTVFAVSCVRTM